MNNDEPLKFYHRPASEENINPNESWTCFAKEREIHMERIGNQYDGYLYDINGFHHTVRFSARTPLTDTLKETLQNIFLEYKKVINEKRDKEIARIDELLNSNRLG